MDPKAAAMMRVIQDAIGNGEKDQVVNFPDGASMRVQRAPEPGVLARIEALETHDDVRAISWAPAGERPAGYPDDLPFLPGQHVAMTLSNGNRNLQWHAAATDSAESVCRTLLAEGWAETTLPAPSMPGMFIRPFRRGDRQRIVLGGGPMLSLLETRAE